MRKLLDHASPLSTLLTADGETICIAKTKNGTKGVVVVHHEAIGGSLCPVVALARRVHNIKKGLSTCPISPVLFYQAKQPTRLSDQDITVAVSGEVGCST